MVFAGQYWSNTLYAKGPIIGGKNQAAFGFNFADGHIEAYGTGLDLFTGQATDSSGLPTPNGGPPGGKAPGNFVLREWRREDRRCEPVQSEWRWHSDKRGHVAHVATESAGQRCDWKKALAYCESLKLAGHQDWRLPDSKELQSIVDDGKTGFPAIDTSVFTTTQDSEALDFWTSTTFGDFKSHANVIAFGEALSKSSGQTMTEEDTCSVNACDIDRPDNLVRCVR